MVTLEDTAGGRRVTLPARGVVGRAKGAALRIPDRRVSSEHARIWWAEGRWWVRDLGSRNGTWLGEARLKPGHDQPLAAGDALGFGGQSRWALSDADPPVAMARPLEGGPALAAEGGQLALPDGEAPSLVIVQGHEGAWLAEGDGGVREVADGEVVHAGARDFRLSLPSPHDTTWAPSSALGAERGLALTFRVSLDEEHVALSARWQGREHSLGSRAHNYLLLTLARQRLADRAAGEPAGERGWLYREDLLRGLRLDPPTMNLYIFRARKALAKIGVPDSAALVERRLDTGQLRIGAERLTVERA